MAEDIILTTCTPMYMFSRGTTKAEFDGSVQVKSPLIADVLMKQLGNVLQPDGISDLKQ